MPLKFKLDKLDGLEPPIAGLYAEGEDKAFYLQVEGVVAKEKLDEFRTNNIELSKKLESFKDVDPVKYKDLVKMEADGKFKGKTPEEIDQIIQERVGTMRTEYETSIDTLKKSNDVMSSQLSVLLVDNVVRDAASKAGISGASMDDVLLRAKATFKLVEGKPVPHDEKGNVVYGTDGTTPKSVTSWVADLKKTAPHLFPQSNGGGAAGGRAGSGVNTANMTAQQKIAAGLQERAGQR